MRLLRQSVLILAALFAVHAIPASAGEAMPRQGAKESSKIIGFYTEPPHVGSIGADGVVTIEWTSLSPSPPATVYFGQSFEEQDFDGPRFVSSVTEPSAPATTTHSVRFDLKTLMNGKLDAANWRSGMPAVAVFRVESYDPVQKRGRLWDGRFRFVKKADSFERVPCITIGPLVATVGPESAVVWFETDLPTIARVNASEQGLQQPGSPLVFDSPEKKTRHEVKLSKLAPGTVYDYSVRLDYDMNPTACKTADGKNVCPTPITYSFKTAPKPGVKNGSFTFALMADSRSSPGGPEQNMDGVNVSTFRAIARAVAMSRADFVMFTGDTFDGYSSTRPDFENGVRTWFKVLEPAGHSIPFYTAIGNHDTIKYWYEDGVFYNREGAESGEAAFADLVVNPSNGPQPEDASKPTYSEAVFSFDYGVCHLTVLNTDYWYTKHPQFVPGNLRGNIMDKQMEWFEADIADARKRGYDCLLVFAHEPAFPNGGHVEDSMWYEGKRPEINAMRTRFWNVVSKNKAWGYFSAHEHNYSRTLIDKTVSPDFENPVWQIISGGAGAPTIIQDKSVPWAKNTVKFSTLEHYVLVTVDQQTGGVTFRALTPFGREIDSGKIH